MVGFFSVQATGVLPSAPTNKQGAIQKALSGLKAMTSGKAKTQRLWVATISSTAPVLDDEVGSNLRVVVVDRDGETRSDEFTMEGWERFTYGDAGVDGWERRGLVPIPASIKAPGAVLVTKDDPDDKRDEAQSLDYVRCIKIATEDTVHQFTAHSWVSAESGQRIFFEGASFLPQTTPPAMRDERQSELQALRGENGPGPKDPWYRAYGYQVYDDLGNAKAARPTLGGTAQLPYPRHMTNNLAKGATGPGEPFLPFDEQFDSSKKQGFNGDLLRAVIPSVAQGIRSIDSLSEFKDFADVLRLYRKGKQANPTDDIKNDGDAFWDLDLDENVLQDVEKEVGKDRLGPLQKLHSKLVEDFRKAHNVLSGLPRLHDLLKFEEPRVLYHKNRGLDVVFSDEEWGRQCVAGVHPSAIQALKVPLAQLGSAIGPQHVDKELAELGSPGGLDQLVADAAAGKKPRLFLLDYSLMDAFWGEQEAAANGKTNGSVKPNQRCEHAGRALLFLQQDNDGDETAMIPIAFELKHRQTALEAGPSAAVVYARQELKHDKAGQALWWLAKTIFRSLDAAYHQLIAHWLRCHACSEPYLLALRRQISAMHPVFKLMLPHFRFTMNINSNARQSLINAGGIVESVFTAGPYALRLSSAAYKSWRFVEQAPPADLAARGMLDGQGKLWLQSYPYAEDGMQIWNELTTYFGEYLRLYYKSNKDVLQDEELQAWWAEVKDEGHPDLKLVEDYDEAKVWGFAGPIPDVDTLTHVLATIAWVSSVHHAGVNFPQYEYSGLPLNVFTLVRRPIPSPSNTEDPAYKALAAAAAKGGSTLQRELLTYVSPPIQALVAMLLVKLLSNHAEGEQTLDERNTLLTDPAAVDANTRFMDRMQALEARFASRNTDPEAWSRYGGDKASLPYTVLIPPCESAGQTMKGVPYSVSI